LSRALIALLSAATTMAADPLLESCLRSSIGSVVMNGDAEYAEARQCKNTRVDIVPEPLAVVRVRGASEVQAAVRCGASHGVHVCARAGGHGFENDAGCSGGVAIDLQDEQYLRVDEATKVVRFGAGKTLGQLYYELKMQYNLVIPGGAESGVGASGLFLGCGRGMLTQLHGLACDAIRGVQYVDAHGNLRYTNATVNPDMFWMARGGGGTFPGIVTHFVVQAFDAPEVLIGRDCTFPSYKAKALIKAWLVRLEEMSDPKHQMFTHIILWNSYFVKFPNLCFDCSPEQLAWFEQTIDAIANETGEGSCNDFSRSWFDQLLFEAGRDRGVIQNNPAALLDRHQGYGEKGQERASKNGGYLVDRYDLPEEFFDTLERWTFGELDESSYPWSVLVLLYNLGGPKLHHIPAEETAYGGRDAKFVVHFKHQWNEDSLSSHTDLMAHHRLMSQALEQYLPCRGFYNYMDGTLPCAGGNSEKWLEAYFADVQRMKAIKTQADPAGVFWSRLSHGVPGKLSDPAATGRKLKTLESLAAPPKLHGASDSILI